MDSLKNINENTTMLLKDFRNTNLPLNEYYYKNFKDSDENTLLNSNHLYFLLYGKTFHENGPNFIYNSRQNQHLLNEYLMKNSEMNTVKIFEKNE